VLEFNSILLSSTFQSFRLLDNKSFKISGIRDFSWSPSDNIVGYWVAEDKDVPARVTLLEIPRYNYDEYSLYFNYPQRILLKVIMCPQYFAFSRQEIRAKNLFNVADCRMHWQKLGDFLCVKVDRYSKVKKEKNEFKYSVSQLIFFLSLYL